MLTGHSLGGNIAQRVALEYDVQEVIVYNAAPIYLKDGLNLFMDKEKDVQLYEERIAKYKRNIKKIEKKRNAYTGNVKRIVAENDIFTRISELLHIGYYIGEELIIKDAGLHGIKSFLGNHQETLKDLIVENKGSDQLSDNYKEITLAEINLFKIFSTDNIAYLEEQITSLIMSKRVMDSLNKNNYKVDFKIFLTKLLAAIEETKQNDNIAIQKDELKD